jgi:enoyl-[acyl-carrier protein] reductase II
MFHTRVCDLLGISVPILQGAMQGGGGVALVAAVSNAGGLGVLPTFGGTDKQLRNDIAAVRSLTERPFGVNIMPMGRGITERCVATCVELAVPVVTTGRADPGEKAVHDLKRAGIKVVSGTEAGGHVGTIATLPLVPQVVDAVQIPVLAAGGIGDGRGFLAAFALGAEGVQMGTRFMATAESDLNGWGRERLLAMRETDTVVTRAITGATVRYYRTPELTAYEEAMSRNAPEAEIAELKRRARAGRAEEKGERRQFAAGQVAGLVDDVPTVADLIRRTLDEAARLAEQMPRLVGHPGSLRGAAT